MSLWDFFRRPNDDRLDRLDGRLRDCEARAAVLAAEWPSYKEQFTRLAQRIEKRAQRAEEREGTVAEASEKALDHPDVVKARYLRAYKERR